NDEQLLRRLRRALATVDHEGQARRRSWRPRLAARYHEAEGRQARGDLQRPSSLLLRQRPEARPDDGAGSQSVRRPLVGPLAGGQGDPPWVAHTAMPRTRAACLLVVSVAST